MTFLTHNKIEGLRTPNTEKIIPMIQNFAILTFLQKINA